MRTLHEGGRKFRQDNRVAGFDYVPCPRCNGTGQLSEDYRDYDAHGSFWVSGEQCSCAFGQVKVAITPAERIAALEELLAELKSEVRDTE